MAFSAPTTVLAIRETVLDEDGHPVTGAEHGDIVNGGPLLVRDGRPFVDVYTEGFVQPDRPSFYFGFAVSRNPRTMAGLTRDGDLLLVTVDGRAPGYSVGESFPEEPATMRALGATDAVNLDGGGSTAMVVDQQLLGRPSDATGERPVGDAILIGTGS
jgi:exopolysaccharide biosynthesis protein